MLQNTPGIVTGEGINSGVAGGLRQFVGDLSEDHGDRMGAAARRQLIRRYFIEIRLFHAPADTVEDVAAGGEQAVIRRRAAVLA